MQTFIVTTIFNHQSVLSFDN